MPALWDTTLASRVRPRTEILEYMVARAAEGRPVRVASTSVLEIAYGFERRAEADPRYRALLAWFGDVLAAEAFSVVALDGRGALIAGRLRAVMPYPSARRDRRSKTMRQAAWLMDVQIAATAFAAGLDIATENRADFEALGDALTALFPAAPPLAIVEGPL